MWFMSGKAVIQFISRWSRSPIYVRYAFVYFAENDSAFILPENKLPAVKHWDILHQSISTAFNISQ